VRSILRFVFVVVPTAALATGVVVAVSRNDQGATTVADGDLQQDLKLASSTTLELAPAGRPQATVSSIEAPPAATPERTRRTKRSSNGARAIRSRAPVVRAAPEPEVAQSTEESETTQVAELAGAATEATVEAPADGGVALPRPTAVPVSYPGPGDGTAGGNSDGGVYGGGGGGVYGGGTVIRGGGVDGDHCQIHGGIFGRRPPIYRQPRGITLGDRVRAATRSAGWERPRSSIGDRVQASTRSSGSQGSRGSSRGSLGDRVRAARGQ
jgi:hypothetical protein